MTIGDLTNGLNGAKATAEAKQIAADMIRVTLTQADQDAVKAKADVHAADVALAAGLAKSGPVFTSNPDGAFSIFEPDNTDDDANTSTNTDVSSLTALLQAYLDQQNEDGVTWRRRLVLALLEQVDQGNLRAIQEVWLRLEGKPGAVEPATAPSLVIDDELARKILQIGREQDSASD
jgi:hypothetical protein